MFHFLKLPKIDWEWSAASKKVRAGNSFIRTTNARFAPTVGVWKDKEEVEVFPHVSVGAQCTLMEVQQFDGVALCL